MNESFKTPKALQGLNADPSMFENSDFLTQNDMGQAEGAFPEMAAPMMPMNDASNFPNLEEFPGIPNAARRKEINGQVATAMEIPKSEKIDQAIHKEVSGMQQKYQNVPKNPKDILKKIVQRGELKETFHMYDTDWTMRALDQSDILLALEEVTDALSSQTGRVTALMFSHVVFSLEAIDGVSIYQIFDEIKQEDFQFNEQEYILAIKRALRQYLQAFPPKVIDELYLKYYEIEQKRNEALDILKNS